MTVRCELKGPIHPLTGEPRLRSHARADLFLLRAVPARRRRPIDATYDAARDSDEFKNYRANADSLDADSAYSRSVRAKPALASDWAIRSTRLDS